MNDPKRSTPKAEEGDPASSVTRASAPLSLDEAFVKARVRARLLGIASAVCIGRFEILRRIGRGGEGSVYEARDQQSGARVALKQLHQASSDRGGGALKREFRALADLVHPNLVTLYELFQIADERFYTMELVLGVDFVSYVRDAPAVCHARLRRVLPQLFDGLDTLHRAGKVHRDLKPSNVLVRDDGHLVILDYGLVVELHAAAERGRFDGTPAYAAPEQLAGRAVAASDLYAVGVMLFQALTGRLPAASKEAVHGDLRPSTLVPEVPADLDQLCTALCASDPSARPTARVARAWCLGERSDLQVVPTARISGSRMPAEVFVGRHALLEHLHALADVRGEGPRALLLHGESGIGKSALLRRFCAERAARGAIVLRGQCYEREHLPYKVLDAVVERLVAHVDALAEPPARCLSALQRAALVRLFPTLERMFAPTPTMDRLADAPRASAGELRQSAFSAIRTLLRTLAQRHEVVFTIDDLQWSDLDSIDLLQHVLSGEGSPAILLVGVTRSVELQTSGAIAALRALMPATCTELSVGPLPSDEAAALFGTLLSADAPRARAEHEACIAQAAGVPFALCQLVEHVRDRELPEERSDAWLGAAIRARAASCSPAAQRLLEVLSIAGRPLETSLSIASAALPPTDLHAVIELCGRKLARLREDEQERCLETYHDLVRAAVTESISPDAARAIHRGIASALSAHAPDRPELLVEHLLGADELERAGLTALRAAERAAGQLAWNRAADLLRIALRVLAPAELREHGAYERLGAALAAAHRHREAAAAYAEAVPHTDCDDDRLRLSGLMAQQHMRAGDDAIGMAELTALLREVGYRLPRTKAGIAASYVAHRGTARVLALAGQKPQTDRRSARSEQRMRVLSLAHTELWLREPLRACLVHAWAIREGFKARDGHLLRAIAGEISQLSVVYGPSSERRVLRLLAIADALRDEARTPYERAAPRLARAIYALQCRSRPLEALTEAEAADELFARYCPGSGFERNWTNALRDFALELTGETGRLREAITGRMHFSEEQEDGYSKDQLLMSLPLVHLLDDDPDAAIAYLRAHWAPSEPMTVVDYELTARLASAMLYRGDAAEAYTYFRDACRRLMRSGFFAFNIWRDNASYQRARNAAALYVRTGEPKLAREARRVIVRMRRAPPVMRAFSRLLEASLAFADADVARCRAALQATIADSAPFGANGTLWCARLRLAQLDGARADEARARAWFRARGVRDPDRWTALGMPGPAAPKSLGPSTRKPL